MTDSATDGATDSATDRATDSATASHTYAVTVVGRDRPGIIAETTGRLAGLVRLRAHGDAA